MQKPPAETSTLLKIQTAVIGGMFMILSAALWRVVDKVDRTYEMALRQAARWESIDSERANDAAWRNRLDDRLRALEARPTAQYKHNPSSTVFPIGNRFGKKEDELSVE